MRSIENFKVFVPVEELLKKLRANRDWHMEIYKEAEATFRDACYAQLRSRHETLDAAGTKTLDKRRPDRYLRFDLKAPISYKDAYDQVIGMLEMTQEKDVEITGEQYQCWILNKWEWHEHWIQTNAIYSPKLRNSAQLDVDAAD